jgi:hypothetical protein
MPDVILTTPGGAVDLQATAAQEQKTAEIKCYFSTFPAADKYKLSLFNVLYERSSYSMVPRLFEDKILELCKQVLHSLLYSPVHTIYDYLDRGYSPVQALNNTSRYIENILRKQNFSLSPEFSDTDALLDDLIHKELDKIPQLEKKTKDVFAKELKYEAIIRLNSREIYPNNYYQLNFRKPLPTNPEEAEFDALVDLYIYTEHGLNNDYPMETYALILTEEAKQNIYQVVSNGQIDPNFTVNDYLTYRPFNKNKDLT